MDHSGVLEDLREQGKKEEKLTTLFLTTVWDLIFNLKRYFKHQGLIN